MKQHWLIVAVLLLLALSCCFASCKTSNVNITFNVDGTVFAERQYEKNEKMENLPTYVPKENEVFEGWFTAPEGGQLVDAETVCDFDDGTVLYAHIQRKHVAQNVYVTFVADGSILSERQYTVGEKLGSLPLYIANENYEFVGWFTAENMQGEAVSADTVCNFSDGTVLYAGVIGKKITLTFDAGDGECSVNKLEMRFGEEVTLPEATHTNVKFIGWTVNGMLVDEQGVAKLNKDTTLTALYDTSVKILLVGNSYSEDSFNWLYAVAKAANRDVKLGVLYHGGATLDQHAQWAKNSEVQYKYYKTTDGRWKQFNKGIFEDAVGDTKYNARITDALTDEKWDVVGFQQGVYDAGMPNRFTQLDWLVNFAKQKIANSDVKLAWNMTWALADGVQTDGFEVFQYNQQTMYKAICTTAQSVILPKVQSGLFSYVVPTGTAVQNARLYFHQELMRDTLHLTADIGRLIASLTWAKAVLNIDLDSYNKLSYTGNQIGLTGQYSFEITQDQLNWIKTAVSDALENPYRETYNATQEQSVWVSDTNVSLLLNVPQQNNHQITCRAFENGVECDGTVEFTTENGDVVSVVDGVLTAQGTGETFVVVKFGSATERVAVKVSGPAILTNVSQLLAISQDDASAYYVLGNDIDFGGQELPRLNSFAGILDGNGFAIKNAKFNGQWNNSLILTLKQTGVLKNIAFVDIAISGPNPTVGAGLVSICNGTMENIYVEISITGPDNTNTQSDLYQTSGILVSVAGEGANIHNCVVNISANKSYAGIASVVGYKVSHYAKVGNVAVLVSGGTMPTVAHVQSGVSDTFDKIVSVDNASMLAQTALSYGNPWTLENGVLCLCGKAVLSVQ